MVRLSVRAHARASRARLRWDGQTLEVWVTAAASKGAANRAVTSAIADWLDVPHSSVRLVSGYRTPIKLVEIEGREHLP